MSETFGYVLAGCIMIGFTTLFYMLHELLEHGEIRFFPITRRGINKKLRNFRDNHIENLYKELNYTHDIMRDFIDHLGYEQIPVTKQPKTSKFRKKRKDKK